VVWQRLKQVRGLEWSISPEGFGRQHKLAKSGKTGMNVIARRWRRSGWLSWPLRNRFARSIVLIVMILAALPAVFILIYAIPGATPGSTIMLVRTMTGQSVDRQWVDLDEVADVVPQSVIMSEDGQFCFHRGVDWAAVNLVVNDALEGEKPRGASTLPMQTMKNLFFWPQRSLLRKGLEVPYAMFADWVWTKHRMLEIYLNIAEWDEGVFGIEAASRHYFNRPASRLTRRQAALLAVTLPNPVQRNPAKPTNSLSRLAGRIERLSSKSGAYVRCLSVPSW